MIKTKIKIVRLTPEEEKIIIESAKEERRSFSSYMVKAALDKTKTMGDNCERIIH